MKSPVLQLYQQYRAAPALIGGITAEYLTGVGKLENRLLIMLDMTRILTEGEKGLQDLEETEPASSQLLKC